MNKNHSRRLYFLLLIIFGFFSFAYADSLEQLNSNIEACIKNKQFEEAKKTIKQALEITTKTHGGDDLESAKLLNSLMVVYFSQKDYSQAEDIQKQILGIMQNLKGSESFEVYQSLKNLEMINERLEKYALAETYRKQAVELGEKLVAKLIKEPGEITQPKVLAFIPTLYTPLPLVLAIPENYTLMPVYIDFNLEDGVFWGEKKTLEALAKSPERDLKSINSPVFRIRFSSGVYQTGPNQFNDEEKIKADSERAGLRNFKSHKTSWGDFPVLAVEADRPDGTKFFLAWLGTNNPYNKAVLVIEYYYPTKENMQPSENNLQIWNNFIEKTTVLSEPDYSKVSGFDYHNGYTIVTRGKAHFKISAQKRKRDGKYTISIKNLGEYIFIDFEDFQEPKSKDKEKFLVLALTITIYEKDAENILHELVKITPEEVDEFKFSGSLVRDFPRISVYSQSEVSIEPRIRK